MPRRQSLWPGGHPDDQCLDADSGEPWILLKVVARKGTSGYSMKCKETRRHMSVKVGVGWFGRNKKDAIQRGRRMK